MENFYCYIGILYYIFYYFVIKEERVIIKIRIVYDVFVRILFDVFSLNDCFYVGLLFLLDLSVLLMKF